jgi:hypothetical protein
VLRAAGSPKPRHADLHNSNCRSRASAENVDKSMKYVGETLLAGGQKTPSFALH